MFCSLCICSRLAISCSKFDLNFHFYADDSQLYQSCRFENLNTLLFIFQQCFSEIKFWMNRNKLKLNDNKSEAILVGRTDILKQVKCTSIKLGESEIPFATSVKNLGVCIDSDLSFSSHVNATIRNVNMDLRRLRQIRDLIPLDVAIVLANALILPKFDYCNSLLCNINKDKIKALQVAQNDAARLVFKRPRHSSASCLLNQLHWLPIEQRIKYKVCSIVHKSFQSNYPEYINEMLHVYIPGRVLRSSYDPRRLVKPKVCRKIGEQSFSFSAPLFWNSLPRHI